MAGIPHRAFGKTGVQVAAIGFGGYHIGTVEDENEAVRIIHAAIDAGITFMDNAWEYHDGRSEELMGKAIHDRRDRVFLMTKVCTHGRDRHVAMQQLEDSLRRLRTDHLDLWQIHEVIYDNDPDLHFAPGGVVEALEQARREGKTRFVGFTGHKHPSIHLKMLAHDYAFDACQLPLNCFDGQFRSFERQVLPELNRRGIAPIGMKSMGGDAEMITAGAVKPTDALRYAMTLPVAVTVSGIDSMEVLRQNLSVARDFQPFTEAEMEALRRSVAANAADGRFELYKTSMRHDGPPGRLVHGFPPMEAQPL
jgi:aryl-alcohol dehydrogenase-like predicted oxidoreductase